MAAMEEGRKPEAKNEDTLAGFGFALLVYFLWGFLPFYLKAVSHIPALEVVAHRVLWSVPLAGIFIFLRGRTDDIKFVFRNPSMMGMAALTASIITFNWLIYVWAIGNDRAIEAALGYYINPLFSVVLGALLLKERLRPAQMAAIGLAVAAVALLTWDAGGLPWISLGLAISWGFYAFFRKTLPVGPNQGFFVEVVMLAVPALAYVLWLEFHGTGHFLGGTGAHDTWLLMFGGVATAVPLMIYANAAKLLKLSTIGIMQYIAPTMIFLIAIFIFKEPFGTVKFVAFCLIWAALIIYSISMFRGRRPTPEAR